MKTIKLLSIAFLFMLILNCSKSDDGESSQQPTARELITSGKWYLESATPLGAMDNCDKQTWYEFFDNDNLVAEGFSIDAEDNCVTSWTDSGTWFLIDDQTLNLTAGGSTLTCSILNLTDEGFVFSLELEGDTQTYIFDKNPGNN